MSAVRRKRKLAFIFRQAKTLLKVFQDVSLRTVRKHTPRNDQLVKYLITDPFTILTDKEVRLETFIDILGKYI